MDIFSEYARAFLVGGAFCVIAQILIDKTSLTPARILVCYAVTGVFLTAVGVYDIIVDFANCGATVPLTGLGYALAKGVEKAVDEKGIIGALLGGFTAVAGGIATAVFFGYFFSLLCRGRKK